MSQPPEPPPLQSIQSADALYTRVLTRGRRLRRERRAFLATAAMSFLMLAAAIPVALTNDDGSQVATTDRTRPTRTSTTSTTMAAPLFEFPDTTTTIAPVPAVQGTTVTTARSTPTTRRRPAATTTPTTARQATTTAPATTSTTVVPISTPASRCDATTPRPSATRGRVLFVRDRDIFMADRATEPPTLVNLTQSAAAESAPAWSPDGTAFVFVRDGGLVVMQLSAPPGSSGEQLTAAGSGDSAPAWSWDATTIAFVRNGDIWLVPSGGTAATKAIDVADPLATPTWSPDSCRLAYTWRGKVLASRTDGTGMVVARDGAREPSWSRTNRLAVVIRTGTTDDIHVATAAAGSSFTQWTTGGATKPSWSGDGDGLAFQTRRAGNADIYTIATAGGSLSPVSTGPDEDTAPAW